MYKRKTGWVGMVAAVLTGGVVWAGETEPSWLHPELGPFSPSVHFNGAVGSASGDPAERAAGHHDPTREEGSVQGLELGGSLRLGWLEGFATYSMHYGSDEEWEDEWEEAFLKVRDLPGGFEVRGGRMLARYGQLNPHHLHAWDFVDMPLVLGRFLGDDGLMLDGGDVTWLHQGVDATFGLTVGFGEAKAHDHDHAHGADHDHAEEDHAAGEEDHDHDHDHAEEVAFAGDVAMGRLFYQFRRDDFHVYESGVSLAVGDDELSRQIAVYGLDFVYRWRENGLESGGRAFSWTTEFLYRDVEAGPGMGHDHDDHAEGHDEGHEGHAGEHDADHHEHDMLPGGSEFGFYSAAVYSPHARWDVGLRAGLVEGDEDIGGSDRWQISPVVTAYLDPYRRASVRLQYNYDDLDDGGEEHAVWLQLGLSWGGSEVR